MAEAQEPHVILPSGQHKLTIIFLHGRGGSGPVFADELSRGVNSSGQTLFQFLHPFGCKWIFPSAPLELSSMFQEEIQQWFNVHSLDRPEALSHLQVDGLGQSIERIHSIIEEELKLVPANNIVLAGISQGYATAIHALLSYNNRLGAFIGLCGWLPFQSALKKDGQQNSEELLQGFYRDKLSMNKVADSRSDTALSGPLQTPLYLSHAKDDLIVNFDLGISACRALRALGMNADFHIYPEGGHWLKEPEDYDNIIKFLTNLIK